MARLFSKLSSVALVERLDEQVNVLTDPARERVDSARSTALELELITGLMTNEASVIRHGIEPGSALARLAQDTRHVHEKEAARLRPIVEELATQVQNHRAAIGHQVQRAQEHCQTAQERINLAEQSESTLKGLAVTCGVLAARTEEVINQIGALTDRMRALTRRQSSGK